jgi:hypothetical protein
MNPTVKQALHFFTLMDQKETPDEQLQALYQSGLISDLLDANVSEVNRDEFRRICGLKPLCPELKGWKTVKLGVHKTPDAYRQALEAAGFKVSDWASQIIDKVTVAKTEAEIDLVVLSVGDLGFKRATRYDAICARAKELGFQLCPDEVGPALRLDYSDQPNGEWLRVAMESLAGSVGVLGLFGVDRDGGGRWLHSGYGFPVDAWGPDDRFVFSLPRKK